MPTPPTPPPPPTAPQRIIIIGTDRTATAAARMVSTVTATPADVLGVVLLDRAACRDERDIGARVLGEIADLGRIHGETGFQAAVVSLPAAMGAVRGRVRRMLADLGAADLTLPTADDVLRGTHGQPSVDLPSLAGRTPRPIDHDAVRPAIGGRCVLITGAGGSIGSELARICAGYGPELLVLADRSDNGLFEIDRQLGRMHPAVRRRALLHDVVDADATRGRFVEIRPDVVFHAAAHKHVPLMEDHPAAAVTNNLFGTKSVADAAVAAAVDRVVVVSTDKAVNPTSVMGATKRMAELYIRALADGARTRFGIVRFGNVLGSACSVLPIWSAQIAEGGPVTVTHREMTRYFMTIPEAASLVARAASLVGDAPPGRCQVFVLDMGQPVRILELACRFVRACGLDPSVEGAPPVESVTGSPTVRIVLTGVRPGEKLHEELAHEAEALRATAASGILAWEGERPDPAAVAAMIEEMERIRRDRRQGAVIDSIRHHVPEMTRTAECLVESTHHPTAAADAEAA